MRAWALSDWGSADGLPAYIPIAMQQAKVLKEKVLTESGILFLDGCNDSCYAVLGKLRGRSLEELACPLSILMGKKPGKTFKEKIRARK
jgi:hypothetical protein